MNWKCVICQTGKQHEALRVSLIVSMGDMKMVAMDVCLDCLKNKIPVVVETVKPYVAAVKGFFAK